MANKCNKKGISARKCKQCYRRKEEEISTKGGSNKTDLIVPFVQELLRILPIIQI